MERTNLSSQELKSLNPRPEIITLDLSYLSLLKAVPVCKDIFQKKEGTIVCLIKPLFEVESNSIKRSGIIDDKQILRTTLISLCRGFIEQGTAIAGLVNSPITGNNGTYEFFTELRINSADISIEYDKYIDNAIVKSSQLRKFEKWTYFRSNYTK